MSENKRLKNTFDKCASEKRAAFVAYVTAGDPDYHTSLQVIDRLEKAGIDVLELGVPFSDPLADGQANQQAACRALESGMTPAKVLDMAAEIRTKCPDLPIILFTYLNPVAYSEDFSDYCRKAAESGVDAFLLLDMPPEEAEDYRQAVDSAGIKLVSLIAPTTNEERVKMISSYANGFIYYVCREGVTGERDEFASGVSDKIEIIKKHCKLPVAAGFGISKPEHVKAAAAAGADGIVVGSAIVRRVQALAEGKGSLDDIENFVSELRKALD